MNDLIELGFDGGGLLDEFESADLASDRVFGRSLRKLKAFGGLMGRSNLALL